MSNIPTRQFLSLARLRVSSCSPKILRFFAPFVVFSLVISIGFSSAFACLLANAFLSLTSYGAMASTSPVEAVADLSARWADQLGS